MMSSFLPETTPKESRGPYGCLEQTEAVHLQEGLKPKEEPLAAEKRKMVMCRPFMSCGNVR